MAEAKRELGGVGTGLLFENDRVKIWELRLGPGERGDVHRHELDYILVQIAGDRVAGVSEPDSRGPYPGTTEADVVPGAWFYIGKGGIETAVNIGREPYHEILIELKVTADA